MVPYWVDPLCFWVLVVIDTFLLAVGVLAGYVL